MISLWGKILKTISLENLETPIQLSRVESILWLQTIPWQNPKPKHINSFCILNQVTPLTKPFHEDSLRLYVSICFVFVELLVYWMPFYFIVWNGEQLWLGQEWVRNDNFLQASDFIKHLLFYSIAFLVF